MKHDRGQTLEAAEKWSPLSKIGFERSILHRKEARAEDRTQRHQKIPKEAKDFLSIFQVIKIQTVQYLLSDLSRNYFSGSAVTIKIQTGKICFSTRKPGLFFFLKNNFSPIFFWFQTFSLKT